ncbi:MAG: hypothetical protein ACI9CU_002015 [Polaribacter sp.]|jgi:hypothetical protein
MYLVLSLIIGFESFGQNLVVNPSFEVTATNCGSFGGEGFFSDLNGSWDNASSNSQGDSCSSPDLFSECNLIFGNPSPTNMPNSLLGFQYSRTGTRHAGIITHEALDEYREYIQGQTSAPLAAGQSYCVSMYVSLGNAVMFATDNMGIYFGNTPYQRDPCPGQTNSGIYVTPQLNYDCAAIADTSNWVRLEWNYVASGGEQYFMIGNFFTNSNTTIVSNPGGNFTNPYAYYFIDDVSIIASNACCYADLAETPIVCAADAPITLSAVGGVGSDCSNTVTGTWSGNGITDANLGTFDPSVAGAGTHAITYTLSCGYAATTSVEVNPCATLSVCEEANGDFTVSGGTGPYTWSEEGQIEDCSACQDLFLIPPCSFPPGCSVTLTGWIEFATGSTVTPGSNYPIQVIDAEGGVIEISSAAAVPACSGLPCELEVSLETLNSACDDNADGSITVTAQGNIGTVTYSWDTNPLQNGATASGLAGGSYTVTATDQQDCTASLTETITVSSVTADAGEDRTICKGGSVTLTATGGVSYVWENETGVTAPGEVITFSPSETTTYSVTATGSGGCTDIDFVTVNVFQVPLVSLTTPANQLCNNASSIELTEDPTGGVFDGAGMNGSTFNPAIAGVGTHIVSYTYFEQVECPVTDTVIITVDLCTGIEDASIQFGLLVHPNPTSGFLLVENAGSLTGQAEFSVTDMAGKMIVNPTQASLDGLRLAIDLSSLSAGMYFLNVSQHGYWVATIRVSKE